MNTTQARTKPLKRQNQGVSTFLAFALLPLSGFATDVYIPSLPSMAASLHISSIQVQLSLSLFLISYGVSQLFVGSVLDSFGRYKLCLISLVVFGVASLIIATTHNIYLIYLMRIVHGLTTAIIIVAKRAFFVDVFTGEKLKHYLSLFSIIWSTGPIVAPFVGGHLQTHFGWEANFYFLAAFAFVMVILEIIYSGETLKHFSDFHLRKIADVYVNMIKTSSFSLGIIMLGVAYSMVMVYNMTGPFIIEHFFNLSPVVAGYSSLCLGLAWMVGGFAGKATINRPFYRKMFINHIAQLVFACVMILCIGMISSVYTMIFFAFIIHVTAGYTFNNYFTFCLGKFPRNAGIASGLTGGITYVIVSIFSYSIIEILPAKDEHNLGYSYLVLGILSMILMVTIFRIRDRQAE